MPLLRRSLDQHGSRPSFYHNGGNRYGVFIVVLNTILYLKLGNNIY